MTHSLKGVRFHDSLTPDRIIEAVQRSSMGLDNPGFCIMCGVDIEGVEPDAREYTCESCGAKCVYGAEELLITTAV